MKWLFSFVFVLGIYGQAVAQLEMPDRSLIMEANKAFNDGDLDKARDNYKEILEMGFVSGDLFFNLGNIYFKKGDLAHAILFFEKGLVVDPKNKNIPETLVLARKLIKDDVIEISEFYPLRIWKNLAASLSGFVWFTFELILALLLLYSIYYLRFKAQQADKLKYFIAALITSAFFLVVLALGYTSDHERYDTNNAIVMMDTKLYSGADDRSDELRDLSAGIKLKIIDREIENWYKVSLANKEEGWTKKELLEEI